jgi:hypothetical protein
MDYGYGRGGGFGRRGGGRGFGFRGASPPWPYVGTGRGGLPRHAYFTGSPGNPPPSRAYGPQYYDPDIPESAPYAPRMTREEELEFLKTQAESMTRQLDDIRHRIDELGKQEENQE